VRVSARATSIDPEPEPRRSGRARLYRIAALLVSTAGVVIVVISVVRGNGGPNLTPGQPVPGAVQTQALFAGIDQHGIELGDPRAPVTLVEFGDLQCAPCAQFSREVLPQIVSRYVRSGKLLLVFRAIDLLGDDSLRAAQMAVALGEQNRLFQFVSLMYENQGQANSEYVNDRYLRALATAITGANVPRALRTRGSASVHAQLRSAQQLGAHLQIASAPSFLLYRHGQPPQHLRPGKLAAASFETALQRLLGRVP